jgi:hypothetical protein
METGVGVWVEAGVIVSIGTGVDVGVSDSGRLVIAWLQAAIPKLNVTRIMKIFVKRCM